MNVKTILTAGLTLLVAGLLALPQPADARRMGGGGNVGKQYSTPAQAPGGAASQAQGQRPAPPVSAAAAAQRPGAAGGASRWLGPLAGLAAGGLLASLFFGGAFEGLQVMDFLLIALLVIGGVLIFRAIRRSRAANLPTPAYGRTGARPQAAFRPAGSTPAAGMAAARAGIGAEAPAWFDAAAFIAGAKGHYLRLQAAWDKADFNDIREYCTPDLCAELQRERAGLTGPQTTEVVQLDATLGAVRRDGDQVVASVQFSGLVREEPGGSAEPFRELWHVQHTWASPAGDWYLSGIQQV